MPYFPKRELRECIQNSPSMLQLIKDIVEAAASGFVEHCSVGEQVRDGESTVDELRMVWDGLEREAFKTRHPGCSPEELFVNGMVLPHKPSQEQREVCLVEGEPLSQLLQTL